MRKTLAVLALLAFPLSVDAAPPKKRATIVEGIVATVGERCIMLSEVRKRVAGLPEAQRTPKALEAELEKMIDEQVVEVDVERSKLTATGAEIDERISANAKAAGMSDAQFLESLEKRGITRTANREATAKMIAADKWEQKVVRAKLKPGEDPVAGRARIVRELRASYDVEVLL